MRISDWSSDVCSSDLNWIYFNHRVIPQANSARSHQGCGIGGPATAPGAGATTADGAGAAPSIGGAINSDASPTGSTWRIEQLGRASCRGRVCQYVEISVVAGTLKKKEESK